MESITVSIDQLLLDPNNYRLHSHPRYQPIEEDQVSNQLVQKRILKMLSGESRFEIKDLIDSFKSNGFLKIDNILVKRAQKANDKYVVIEGNRRIATLKSLQEDYHNGFDIGKLSPKVFQELEVILYDELDDEAYLLLMGLRHVSGVKPWNDYEQAELIKNLTSDYKMSQVEIANRLGISRQEVKRKLNSFKAMEIYRNDDEYGDQFSPDMAGLFHELMSRPLLREWLGWNESLGTFTNKVHLDRFFSWISKDETEKRILSKRDQVRDLNKIIMDPEALDVMENTKNLVEALDSSTYLTNEGFKKNIKSIRNNIARIPVTSLVDMDKDSEATLKEIIKTVEAFKKFVEA